MITPGRYAQLHDAHEYFRGLTFRKAVNALKVLGSYYLSKVLKKNFHSGMPLSMAFEPTTSCNLKCPHCPSGLRQFTRPTGNMQDVLFHQTLDELEDYLTYLIFYFQGEPYLNRKMLDWVAEASRRGIYTATSTNAHYLNPDNAEKTVRSGLSRLIISLDGTTQDEYERYRIGGSLEKVKDGIRNVLYFREKTGSKTPFVMLQFIVFRHNEHRIEEVRELGRELGVDHVAIKTAQIYDYENGDAFIPTNETYSRYRKMSDGKFQIKNKMSNSCWKMWHSCVMTWDGKVVPCCFDKDADHQMGQIGEHTTFCKIWEGTDYRAFRQSLLRSRSEIEICKNCTEGTKVWAG